MRFFGVGANNTNIDLSQILTMADRTFKLLTLLFVRRPGQVLLGMKKRGFGAGRYNGFGERRHH